MGFLITWLQRKEKSSASAAKDRLLEVLIHDRVKVTPATMEQIRQEIIAVLSKYIDIDREGMEVTLTRAEGTHQLTANIPIRRNERFDRLAPTEDDSESNGGAGEARDQNNASSPRARADTGSTGSIEVPSGPEASRSTEPSPSRRSAPASSSLPNPASPPPQRFGPPGKKRH